MLFLIKKTLLTKLELINLQHVIISGFPQNLEFNHLG